MADTARDRFYAALNRPSQARLAASMEPAVTPAASASAMTKASLKARRAQQHGVSTRISEQAAKAKPFLVVK